MFKRTEKKIKVVFMLHFAASQVPPLKRPALTVSLIPEDLGKPTVKLRKAPVKDGTCSWEHPVFETMKLVKILKTGVLKEKIYHFIVSAGSSKSGFLGKHPLISQNLQWRHNRRQSLCHLSLLTLVQFYIDGILSNQFSNHDTDESNRYIAVESPYQDGECDGSFRLSNSNSYWNGSSEHNDKEEFESGKKPVNGVVDGISRNENGHQRSKTESSMGTDLVDSTNSSEDSLPRETLPSAAEASIEKLEEEISMLQRQVSVSELEIQSLRKQVTKESKRGDNLMAQNTCLKEERNALRTECKQLRSSNNSKMDAGAVNQMKVELDNTWILLEETRQELTNEKEVSTNLQLQIQKTQELNNNLVLAVKDLEEILEQKNREVSVLSSMVKTKEETLQFAKLGKDGSQPSLNTLLKENDDRETSALEKMIEELSGEIDIYRKHREDMEMHMEQLTLDYEALKQEKHHVTSELEQSQRGKTNVETECNNYIITIRELESEVHRLEEENRLQAQELSESLVAIEEFRCQVKELQKEMEELAQGHKDDLDAATRAKLEQEQRAIRSEEALRMARYRNTKTSERHEEELRRLSLIIASKVDENEKRATKAAAEVEELRAERKILEEALQNANEEIRLIKTQTEAEEQELSNRIEQISFELNRKSTQLRTAQKHLQENETAFLREADMLRVQIEGLTGEKEKMTSNLQSVVEQLRTEVDKLNQSLSQEQEDKGYLSKRIVQLENDLRKREEEVTSMELRIKTMSTNQAKTSEASINARDSKSPTDSDYSMDVLDMKEKLEALEKQVTAKEAELQTTRSSFQENERIYIRKVEKLESSVKQLEARHVENNAARGVELLTEMETLKEKNISMSNELIELQERYLEITLKFAQVESERQQLVMTVRNLKNGKN